MEATFKDVVSKVKEGGNLSVDAAIQWMKEANIIDGKDLTEEKVRRAFERFAGGNLDFAKFEEVLTNISEESKHNLEELQRMLQAAKPQIISLVEEGVNAITKALEEAKK